MSKLEKIGQSETQIKNQLEALRNNLNKLNKHYKDKPNDWVYITALSHVTNALSKLNNDLLEIDQENILKVE